MLATHYKPSRPIVSRSPDGVSPFAETYQDHYQGAAWLRDIAILGARAHAPSALRTSQGNSAAISTQCSGNLRRSRL